MAKRYYAGRSAASYTRELEQLARNREQAPRGFCETDVNTLSPGCPFLDDLAGGSRRGTWR